MKNIDQKYFIDYNFIYLNYILYNLHFCITSDVLYFVIELLYYF